MLKTFPEEYERLCYFGIREKLKRNYFDLIIEMNKIVPSNILKLNFIAMSLSYSATTDSYEFIISSWLPHAGSRVPFKENQIAFDSIEIFEGQINLDNIICRNKSISLRTFLTQFSYE